MKSLIFCCPWRSSPPTKRIDRKEVRHELIMLPYYSVFDNLAYRVDGTRVRFWAGSTPDSSSPTPKTSVKKIEGVTVREQRDRGPASFPQ